jgi:hypothetical protein
MEIELSNIIFTDQDDIVPPSGVEERLINTEIANTLAGDDILNGDDDILNGDTGNLDTFWSTPRLIGIFNIGTLNTNDGNDILTGISNNLSYSYSNSI